MMKQPTTVRDVLRRESEATLRWVLSSGADSERKRVIAAELGRRRAHDAGPELMKALAEARTTSDWRVVEAAAEALGRIGFEAAGPYLTELFSDPGLPVGVRDTAAFALGRTSYRRSIPTLITALSAPNKTVRLCAAAALAALADSSIVPRIQALLPTEADGDVRRGLERLLSTLQGRPHSSQQGWLLTIVGESTNGSTAPQTQSEILSSTPSAPRALLRTAENCSILDSAVPTAVNEFLIQSRVPWRSPNDADSHPAPRRHQAWPAPIATGGCDE